MRPLSALTPLFCLALSACLVRTVEWRATPAGAKPSPAPPLPLPPPATGSRPGGPSARRPLRAVGTEVHLRRAGDASLRRPPAVGTGLRLLPQVATALRLPPLAAPPRLLRQEASAR